MPSRRPLLHHHPDPASTLRTILAEHLPLCLPVYNATFCPGNALYATFVPGTSPGSSSDAPWVALACLQPSQLRPFVSTESISHLSEDRLDESVKLLKDSVSDYVQHFAAPTDQVTNWRLGAVNSRWSDALRSQYPSLGGLNTIHISPDVTRLPVSTASLPKNMSLGRVREQDIPLVMAGSEVPHSAEYLLSRLSHSSAIFDSSAISGSEGQSSSPEMVACCFTHRDGSSGTLWVSEKERRQGLAQIVLFDRHSHEATRAFTYVKATNTASRSLMNKVGLEQGQWLCEWLAFGQ